MNNHYCKQAENRAAAPSLFDLLEVENVEVAEEVLA